MEVAVAIRHMDYMDKGIAGLVDLLSVVAEGEGSTAHSEGDIAVMSRRMLERGRDLSLPRSDSST